MRARRLIGAGALALVMSGTMLAPATQTASAAPARSTTSASATSSTSTSRYRLVRSARMRQVATRADRATVRAITTAVRTSEFTTDVPAADYRVTGVRVNGSWARATLAPTATAELDPATVLLQRSRGAWSVVDLGTAEVGCGVAPAATLKALDLDCS